ncbi:MBL fold metallo-hydrolase [Desulfogranum japonicum]|uniref:MBL fold metallo-hydrolase n=1 Tax=Desulfogranum japonicum TaxID=231447 RepID=UPI00040AE2A2|nr:MBL fold metallo-hydrolase [Desulfogranum japonicum]
MKAEYTILCENSVADSRGLIGEHGWSVLIETPDRRLLFDTGQGMGLLHNSRKLGKDLQHLDAIILSHGHYDHTSGLPAVLEQTGVIDVYGHPDMFITRYWDQEDGSREIGIRYRREYLESLGMQLQPISEFTEIFDGVYLTGEVPRTTSFEVPDPHMKQRLEDGSLQQDQLRDDLSMVIRGEKGLVVVLGCAHAGLINILRHVQKNLPGEPIYSVFGGTHLGFGDADQFQQTLEALESFNIEQIGAAHCTGLVRSSLLHHHFGDRFFFAAVGCQFSC